MLIQVKCWNNLECTFYSFAQSSTLTCSLLPRLRANQVWMLKPSLTNSTQKSLVAQTAKCLDSDAILAKMKMLQGTCSDCLWFMRRFTVLQWPVRHCRWPAARDQGAWQVTAVKLWTYGNVTPFNSVLTPINVHAPVPKWRKHKLMTLSTSVLTWNQTISALYHIQLLCRSHFQKLS